MRTTSPTELLLYHTGAGFRPRVSEEDSTQRIAPKSRVHALFKHLAEVALASRPLATLALPRRASARLNLAYHDITRAADHAVGGDRSLHLPFDRFLEQLDAIREHGLPVEGFGAPQNARGGAPALTITFDDACAGAVTTAIPELAARRMPATIFVAPGLLGSAAPWWDLLAVESLSGVPPQIRERALGEFNGRHGAVIDAAKQLGWPVQAAAPAFRIATADEIDAALSAHPQLTLGAHSWDHLNLASLEGPELAAELARPLEWLRKRWPDRTIPWLAYPYGLETPTVRRAAKEAGYAGGLLIRGGWYRNTIDAFGTPRLNVSSGISLTGFRARLNGFLCG